MVISKKDFIAAVEASKKYTTEMFLKDLEKVKKGGPIVFQILFGIGGMKYDVEKEDLYAIAKVQDEKTRGVIEDLINLRKYYTKTIAVYSESNLSIRLISRGKSVASFTLSSRSRRAVKRSSPMPKPPCGGMPYLKA